MTFSLIARLVGVAFILGVGHFLMQAYLSPAEPVEWKFMISVLFGVGIALVAYIRMRRKARNPKQDSPQ